MDGVVSEYPPSPLFRGGPMYRFLCIFSFFFILSLCVGLFTALCGLHLFFAWHGVDSLAMFKVLLKSDNMHLNIGVLSLPCFVFHH
jgi:hypothetical protein